MGPRLRSYTEAPWGEPRRDHLGGQKKSMYADYYKLHRDPFRLTPEPELSYAHPSYAKAWAYLQYGLRQNEGFVVITGRAGSGKTTLMRALLEEHRNARLTTAALVHTRFDARDLAAMVAHAFGQSVEGLDRIAALDRLRGFLEQQLQHGNRAVLIIDEAQGLSPDALHELYVLSSLDFNGRPLLQIFLLGQEELRQVIHAAGTEHLRQRLIAACHLEPLDAEQTEAYVRHRLTGSGWGGDPELDPRLFGLLQHFSDGLPRRINTLCSRLLLYGAVNEHHRLGPDDLIQVVEELREERLYTPGASPQSEGAPVWDVAPEEAATIHAPPEVPAPAAPMDEDPFLPSQPPAPAYVAPGPAARPQGVAPARDVELAIQGRPEAGVGAEPEPALDAALTAQDLRGVPRPKRRSLAGSVALALTGAVVGIGVLLAYDRYATERLDGDATTAAPAAAAAGDDDPDLITMRLPEPLPRRAPGDGRSQTPAAQPSPSPTSDSPPAPAPATPSDEGATGTATAAPQPNPTATEPPSPAAAHDEAPAAIGDDTPDNEIATLLEQAETAMADFRLTTPETDSALFYYRAVLVQDPDNAAALEGFEEIVSRYVLLARNALDDGRPDLARVYVRRGLAVDPGNPQLEALR